MQQKELSRIDKEDLKGVLDEYHPRTFNKSGDKTTLENKEKGDVKHETIA